jgi:thiol-disulfide isomerase/thioredoxin
VFLASLAGLEAELSRRRGRRFLVHHLATWCDACLEELPLLLALHAEVPNPDFLGVSWELFMGWEGPEEACQRTRALGLPFPVAVYTGPPEELFQALGIESGTIPHTVIYAEDGRVVVRLDRPLEEPDLELLRAALQG